TATSCAASGGPAPSPSLPTSRSFAASSMPPTAASPTTATGSPAPATSPPTTQLPSPPYLAVPPGLEAEGPTLRQRRISTYGSHPPATEARGARPPFPPLRGGPGRGGEVHPLSCRPWKFTARQRSLSPCPPARRT